MPTKNLLTKNARRKVYLALSVGVFMSYLGTAQAEDIEIFTNAFTSNGEPIAGNPDFEPNVLLIVDNSTSMGRSGPVPDESRQQVPLNQVIRDTGITIGLEDRPQQQANASGFCDDNHNGGTGDINTKNRYFYYPDPSQAAGTFSVSFCETRFDTLQRSLRQVLASEADGADPDDVFSGINIGLMRMNRNRDAGESGGTIVNPVLPIGEGDNRQDLRALIEDLDFGQNTPVAETLYEGYLYFSGLAINDGFTTLRAPGGTSAEGQINWLDNSTEARQSYQTAAGARNGNTYESPIKTQCQDNTIVFLSDGNPTADNNSNTEISGLITGSCNNCADDIAEFMNGADNVSPNVDGETVNSEVNTITIGLNIDSQTLRNIGAAGTGIAPARVGTISPNIGDPTTDDFLEFDNINQSIDYYTVSQPNQLAGVFADIFSNLGGNEPALFAAPAISVDSFNRLSNRNEIYFALFQPVTTTRWPGNVKRYTVSVDSPLIRDDEVGVILDDLDQRALTDEGAFVDTAVSAWTDPATPDGNIVPAGGAAANLILPRRLFGRVGANTEFLSDTDADSARDAFLDAVGRDAGSAPFLGEVGVDDDALEQNRVDIANFSLNIDQADDTGTTVSNGYLGDNLHGDPYVLTFGDDGAGNFEDVIFYTSNQGMLHAIDGDDGSEMWAYLPDDSLFENLGVYFNNFSQAKEYGLDAEIAFSVNRDATGDVTEAVLFFGQRRGGNSLFAVDVSNATDAGAAPFEHLWTVDADSPGMDSLGQTWAQPVVTRVNVCADGGTCAQIEPNEPLTEAQLDDRAPEVLFVAGGYDTQYDDASLNVAGLAGSVQGNALYMLDAETGDLLWVASDSIPAGTDGLVIPEMEHSVVARPTVLDTDFNGVADTIFFSDISGQVFRIDFRSTIGNSDAVLDSDDSVSGGLIAQLSDDADNQRFFNPLNVALLPAAEGDPAVASENAPIRYVIATGSGYRAHPLDAETDGNSMYVVYDENISFPLQDSGAPSYQYYCTGSQADDTACTGVTPRAYVPGDFDVLSFDSTLLGSINNAILDETVNQAFPTGNDLDIPVQVGYRVPTSFAGEKIISQGLISNFMLSYATYIPSAENAGNFAQNCTAGLGSGVFFSFDLNSGEVFAEVLDSPGIPTQPAQLEVLDANGNLVSLTIVGREIIQDPPELDDDGNPLPVNGNPNDLGKANRSVWWETDRAE